MGRPIDGYVRVSRVGGREGASFISPDLQEERIRAYAESRGFQVGIVLRDLDSSGADLERPKLRALLDRIASGESGGLIVARIDRFARSAIGALQAFREIENAGGVFISVEDRFDTSTGFGQAMMTILLAIAELELARIRDTWKTSQRKAVARGVHPSSRLPVGYRRGERCRLVPDETTAPVVLEAFHKRAGGATYREIAAFFNEQGLRSSAGNIDWKGYCVEGVLKNRVYLGEARSGGYRNVDAHQPLVPIRLWLEAQFGAELRVAHPSARSLLAGLIRCAGCCYVLEGSWKRRAGGQAGAVLNGYRCRVHFRGADCLEPAWALASEIEALVVERFFARLGSRRGVVDLDAAEAELRAAERAFSRLSVQEPLGSGERKTTDAFAAAMRVESANGEFLALLRRDALNRLPRVRVLRKAWPTMSIPEQRAALGLAFDAVVVERGKGNVLGERVHFIKAGELPDYFPLGGRSPARPTRFIPSGRSASVPV